MRCRWGGVAAPRRIGPPASGNRIGHPSPITHTFANLDFSGHPVLQLTTRREPPSFGVLIGEPSDELLAILGADVAERTIAGWVWMPAESMTGRRPRLAM